MVGKAEPESECRHCTPILGEQSTQSKDPGNVAQPRLSTCLQCNLIAHALTTAQRQEHERNS